LCVPTNYLVLLFDSFCQFGLEPIATELPNQKLAQKVVKGKPPLGGENLVANCNNPLPANLNGNNWTPVSLLFFALLALGGASAHCTINLYV